MDKDRKRYNWLAEIINQKKYKIGAEVGVMTGQTTKYLLKHCPTLGLLYAVDSWIIGPGYPCSKNTKKLFMRRLRLYGRRLIILEGNSWDMAKRVKDNSLNFVFIDASHDYASVTKDLAAWIPKVRKGGLICGHDYNSMDFPGVKQAVDKVFKNVETEKDKIWFTWKT